LHGDPGVRELIEAAAMIVVQMGENDVVYVSPTDADLRELLFHQVIVANDGWIEVAVEELCLLAGRVTAVGGVHSGIQKDPTGARVEQVGTDWLAQDETAAPAACRDGFGEDFETAQEHVQTTDTGGLRIRGHGTLPVGLHPGEYITRLGIYGAAIAGSVMLAAPVST